MMDRQHEALYHAYNRYYQAQKAAGARVFNQFGCGVGGAVRGGSRPVSAIPTIAIRDPAPVERLASPKRRKRRGKPGAVPPPPKKRRKRSRRVYKGKRGKGAHTTKKRRKRAKKTKSRKRKQPKTNF